jgi:hypothetical protein
MAARDRNQPLRTEGLAVLDQSLNGFGHGLTGFSGKHGLVLRLQLHVHGVRREKFENSKKLIILPTTIRTCAGAANENW